MTKVIFNYDGEGGIYFDCLNHAGDDWPCACASTLCNVLAYACHRKDIKPRCFEPGHVTIEIRGADEATTELFQVVEGTFEGLQEEFPDHIKIY